MNLLKSVRRAAIGKRVPSRCHGPIRRRSCVRISRSSHIPVKSSRSALDSGDGSTFSSPLLPIQAVGLRTLLLFLLWHSKSVSNVTAQATVLFTAWSSPKPRLVVMVVSSKYWALTSHRQNVRLTSSTSRLTALTTGSLSVPSQLTLPRV